MQAEYIDIYGCSDQDPDNSMSDAIEVLLMQDNLGHSLGIIAWSLWPNGDGKIRLLYVLPVQRGIRLAETMLTEVEMRMSHMGVRYVRFEAGPWQPAAHRLYERHGYSRLSEGFGYYQDNPGSVFFGREL